MKLFRNKIFISAIAILVSILTILTDSNIVQAAISTEYSQDETSNELFDLRLQDNNVVSLSNNTSYDVKQVYADLSYEAKIIFVKYLQSYDHEMYNFHKTYVDPKVETTIRNFELLDNISFDVLSSVNTTDGVTLSTTNFLQTLDSNLSAIQGLADAVKYALLAAGSSIIAAISSLTIGQIVAILVAVGCSAVLIANWDNVSSHWSEIVTAFKDTFNSVFSESSMGEAFETAKPNYENPYRTMQEITTTIRTAYPTASFSKHIEQSFALNFVRNRNAIYIYYSAITKKALFVYAIPNGVRANINSDFYAHSTWQLPNYIIPGGKLFVIYDFNAHALIHAHLRLFYDDTEAMRYGNLMSWQVRPVLLYDPKYEIGGSTWLNGDIFTRLFEKITIRW